jgi:hypothetical protein
MPLNALVRRFGAREGNRTLDLLITSELLCRLSYPGGRRHVSSEPTLAEAEVQCGGNTQAASMPSTWLSRPKAIQEPMHIDSSITSASV